MAQEMTQNPTTTGSDGTPATQMDGLRLLVCGGRDFYDKQAVYAALDRVHAHRPIACVIAGGAPGADHLGAAWARERGITLMEFPPDWHAHGRAAGPIRNKQMLDEGRPSGVVAFPGGRGTENMTRQAEERGIKIWRPMA